MSAFQRPEHAIYLSLTEVTIGADTSQLRVKVFSDDLQNALRNYSDRYQHAELKHFFSKNQFLAEKYFREHLQISLDNKPVSLRLLGHAVENDAHFITFHFHSGSIPGEIQIKADFLMELFPTQTNVVKIEHLKEHKYLKFVKGSETQQLTWNH